MQVKRHKLSDPGSPSSEDAAHGAVAAAGNAVSCARKGLVRSTPCQHACAEEHLCEARGVPVTSLS